MTPEAQLALATGGGGAFTLVLTEVIKRFKSRQDKRLSDAQAGALEAEGDARILGAATAAFTALTERMSEEVSDLRERVRRCEDEMLELRTERDYLVQERDRVVAENHDLRSRLDLALGEVRQLQQLTASAVRVYGQEEEENADGQQAEP
jgi:regulator of replication initiation timing